MTSAQKWILSTKGQDPPEIVPSGVGGLRALSQVTMIGVHKLYAGTIALGMRTVTVGGVVTTSWFSSWIWYSLGVDQLSTEVRPCMDFLDLRKARGDEVLP